MYGLSNIEGSLRSPNKAGDECLSRSGNSAYDALKLVEPLCNLRLSDLAHHHRPLIPKNNNFKCHLDEAISSTAQEHPNIYNLSKLILEQTDVNIVLTIYGSFRHWGHPFIDYLKGLEALYNQVNLPKVIGQNFANELASDLAYIVLKDQFDKDKKWYVNINEMPPNHLLYSHVRDKTWPTPKQILDYGPNWHRLPLTKCFDIPDMIDPSQIYSDKSHSPDLDEVVQHINSRSELPTPNKRVLSTYLVKRQTNWPEFLRRIDREGLDVRKLLIGLKGKERKLKLFGRFYALMSWELREYFVITEYLIKKHFVPLFKGLTMADNSTVLIKKTMDNSHGQGLLRTNY